MSHDFALNILLPVADFCRAMKGVRWRIVNPGQLMGDEFVAKESRVVFSSLDKDGISTRIFAYDEPGFSFSAQTESFALANRIVGKSVVFANLLAIESEQGARLKSQELAEKLFEISFTDEANAGAVFFIGGCEFGIACQGSHLAFE